MKRHSTVSLLAALAAGAAMAVCLEGTMFLARLVAIQNSSFHAGGTIFAQKGQELWYAPGGDDPSQGYLERKLATLDGGEKMIITADKDGTMIVHVFGSGTWYRVVINHEFAPPLEGTYEQTGWVRLP